MKIRVEIVGDISHNAANGPAEEESIVIRCRQVDDRVQRIQRFIAEAYAPTLSLTFYRGEEEYYFPLGDVLFFETEGEKVFAHTAKEAFFVKRRLYELEQVLPRQFVRSAKGTILNVRYVYSIQRNLASASLVQFMGSHKQVYISRLYFKEVKQRLDDERSKL